MMRLQKNLATQLLVGCVLLASCRDRARQWNAALEIKMSGLQHAVALLDAEANRVVMLSVPSAQHLTQVALPIGRNVQATAVSADGSKLFVLCAGKARPAPGSRTAAGEPAFEDPSLTVIDGATSTVLDRVQLATPLAQLAVDPLGRWVVAYGAPQDTSTLLSNPNALVIFDTQAPVSAANPTLRTLRSFGGTPQHIDFTQSLTLAKGARRLLVISTERDVALLDLDHVADLPVRPEVTVRLTTATQTTTSTPAGVIDDNFQIPRIAIRLATDDNVVMLDLVTPEANDGNPNDFTPRINLVDVGGVASAIAFVQTDAGRRLLALVPSKQSAMLADPETSSVTSLTLPASYANLSLLAPQGGIDTALLWNGTAAQSGVALLSLGATAARPYDSVEVLGIEAPIAAVVDVPAPHAGLKILQTSGGGGLYVLNLSDRTAAPLVSTHANTQVTVAAGDATAWVFAPETTQLAALDLATLHPQQLSVDAPLGGVFDVLRSDGTHALIAIHNQGLYAATVFDAASASSLTSRFYTAVLLGDLP